MKLRGLDNFSYPPQSTPPLWSQLDIQRNKVIFCVSTFMKLFVQREKKEAEMDISVTFTGDL